jgi:hypothetical protein
MSRIESVPPYVGSLRFFVLSYTIALANVSFLGLFHDITKCFIEEG